MLPTLDLQELSVYVLFIETQDTGPPLAIAFALQEEVRPLLQDSKVLIEMLRRPSILRHSEYRGIPLLFCRTGVGMNPAHEGIEFLLDHYQPRLILSVGYAGGTDHALKTGDLLLASVILSETATDHFAPNAQARDRLEQLIREEKVPYQKGPLATLWRVATRDTKQEWGRRGTMAVDMETAAAAAVAIKNRIPFVSLRAIFDTVEEELPFPEPIEGEPRTGSFFIKNPKSILKIPRYLRMSQICQKNLVQVVSRFIHCWGR